MVAKLFSQTSSKLLVGADTLDDAAAYQLSPTQALLFTVDLFPPVVENPRKYGRIAAANSLSDIFAMGGEPFLALNIFAFPPKEIPPSVVEEILKGGMEKVEEAGAILAGGHTMRDEEVKYGLCVAGFAHPEKIITNSNAQPGDVLLLTKPLGTGILTTALKKGLLESEKDWQALEVAMDVMEQLNQKAAQAMVEVGAHSATDVTGFGLLGHALEMAEASQVTLEIWANALPLLPRVRELLQKDTLSGGSKRNQKVLESKVKGKEADPDLFAIACDAQTSGGLLIALEENKLDDFFSRYPGEFWTIGRVKEWEDSPIHFTLEKRSEL